MIRKLEKKHNKRVWNRKNKATQKKTFHYWSTKEGRKERSSLGGKSSIKSSNNPWSYWASEEGRKQRSSMGGKAHKGKKCMYKPGDKSFIRVKPEDIQSYLNEGYIFGSPHSSKNQYSSF